MTGHKRRVLVIDDRRDASWTLATLLRALGYETAVAEDGESGLKKAREFMPDVILSDIGLPKMDGCEFAQAVRNDPQLRHVHLIATSGYDQDEEKRRATEAGFNDYLVKPVGFEELQNALAAAMT